MSFVHLHTHTEYSMLDGASKIEELVSEAVRHEMPALGMTDHGNLYGVVPFYQECKKQGIKPIIGTELYQALNFTAERPNMSKKKKKADDSGDDGGTGKLYYHLTALAETNEGYRNLVKLSSKAFLDGYYYKPRVDWKMLDEHHKGLILTTGCLGGQVLQALLHDDFDKARATAGRLQDIAGRDNLFVELQDHGLPEQASTNPDLIRIARQLGAPLLVTNDSHYTTRDQHESHDALLCIQTGARQNETKRFKFESDQHYLKSPDEMRLLFPGYKEASDNTLWIAERANVELDFNIAGLPHYPVPEGYDTDAEYLMEWAFEGAIQRYGSPLPDAVINQLTYELEVIENMGFSAYFLIVADLIRHAKECGIRTGPGRGSAAGAIVAYALGITELDPLHYGLLFERFLNPSRISMPDIDMDFDTRGRDEMIRYSIEKYGYDKVAQIITYSTIKSRAAVRDTVRVLSMPYALGNQIIKAMPPMMMGRDTPLKYCFEPSEKYKEGFERAHELRQLYKTNPDVKKIIDTAKGLEGLRRQDGIHAAAVVISDKPLTDYLPVQRKPDKDKKVPIEKVPLVTQYEMGPVEQLGLLKMDYLGLKNLDIITDTLKFVHERHGITVDMNAIPLDDEKTFDLLRAGKTIGVFQLESAPMRDLIKALAPTTFDDIAALVALYRPGPMAANMHYDYADRKNGRAPVRTFHSNANEVLGETYGLMIYQEQMMKIAQVFAGYSLAEADNLRKACGKKVRELMAKERDKFVEGVANNGYSRELGTEIFDIIEPFADYSFNKSHAVCYGFIAYQTAWLKANYPIEYMSCLLSANRTVPAKLTAYLNECRKLDLVVVKPDINLSRVEFAPHDDKIMFGFAAISSVGITEAEKLVREREKNGPYKDFFDYCDRVGNLNMKAVNSLIQSGCFDGMGYSRLGLAEIAPVYVPKMRDRKRKESTGAMTLFSMPDFDRMEIPDVPLDKNTLLTLERQYLGLYVSDHPLLGVSDQIPPEYDYVSVADVEDEGGDYEVNLLGVILEASHKTTKKGDRMAILTVEDLTGSARVVVFPRQYKSASPHLYEGGIVYINANREERDDGTQYIANKVLSLADLWYNK